MIFTKICIYIGFQWRALPKVRQHKIEIAKVPIKKKNLTDHGFKSLETELRYPEKEEVTE